VAIRLTENIGNIMNLKKRTFLHSKIFSLILMSAGIFLFSCVGNDGGQKSDEEVTDTGAGTSIGSLNSDGSLGAGPGSDAISGDGELSAGRAELRHIVDPFDGSYKTKVTIPKNFTGLLFLSGLNITSLSDKLVSVRFNFGRDLEPVVIPATIGRAPGLTPQTDIEVLILDVNDRPFENIRLLYDLYDYNDYRNGSGVETTDPVSDPRDTGLYCRGLKLEHDSTFESSVSNIACDAPGERCLFSYAKILDSGLVNASSVAEIPTEPVLDIGLAGLANDSDSVVLKKCLPDSNDLTSINTTLNQSLGSLAIGTNISLNSNNFTYQGPFRPVDEASWQLSSGALFSLVNSSTEPTGIFQTSFIGSTDSGFKSFLFPRAGKLDLQAGVEFLGSTGAFDNRSLQNQVSSGDSLFVDGCNIRVQNFDETSNEGIGSCNVSGTIELITTSLVDGEVEVLAQSLDVKLQLIRPSLTNFQGEEVLFTSLKTCTNGQACGGSECCFNNRCWGRELVGQCLEDAQTIGNIGIGGSCASDYECSSLCCNQGTGTCAVHINTQETAVLCSKSPGQQCVAKEFCRKENISQCLIVKTGTDAQGQLTCALRCFNVPTHGNCLDGVCTPPSTPAIPNFDPANPDCTTAVDPPSF
jgi:hypothetical protein